MNMKRTIALVSLVGLTACSVSEEKFAAKSASISCGLYEECELLDAFGGDLAACEEAVEELMLAFVTAEGCEYDGSAASACLKETKGTTCDDLTSGEADSDSACNDVCGTAEEEEA